MNFRKIYLLIVSALLLTACNRNRVDILHFSPTGEVDELTTFEVEFDRELAPVDQQDQWLDDEFIAFDPPIKGKFKWLSGKTLIFSPEAPLKPSQKYKASVTDKVTFNTEYKVKADPFEFHTPMFDATGIDFFWNQIPHSDYKVSIQANLNFNYRVDPEKLKEHIRVEMEGKEFKKFQIKTDQPSDIIAIDFGEQQQIDKVQKFKVTVLSGLPSSEADSKLSEDRTFTYKLEPLTKLAITDVTSGFDGEKGWIEVYTSQMVDEEKLDKYVAVSPSKSIKYFVNANSFRIEGDFEPGAIVEIDLKKGLPGLYGGTLEHAYEDELIMADLSPSLRFADKKGKYLSLTGLKNIEVEAVNVDEVDVEIYEVFANNILFFIYGNGGDYYSYGEEDYYDSYYGKNLYVDNYGKLLQEDTVRLPDRKNQKMNFTVNMQPYLDQRFKGMYVVNVRDRTDYWRRDAKMVIVTDLGMIAKYSGDDLVVFVNSIATAEPVSGVEVSLISTNNQTLLKGETDVEGVVRFKDVRKMTEGFKGRLVYARKGDDVNFIDMRETDVELARFDISGKHMYSDIYDTYLYAERDLYRPGEEAHFSGIVRTVDYKTVTDVPVIFRILTPQGKVFEEYRKKLNSQGSFEASVKLPDYLMTGGYTAQVLTGGDDLLASYHFSVEEFVPDKIRVNLSANEQKLEPGEKLTVDAHAEYLFGAAASGHLYEYSVHMDHATFRSKNYPKFNFSTSGESDKYLDDEYDSGELDEKGDATIEYVVPEDVYGGGLIRGNFYVTVFDMTNRNVTRAVPFEVYPKNYFLGIHSPQYYYNATSAIRMKMIAVNPADQALKSFGAEVELIRYEWKTVLKKRNNNTYYYSSEKREIPVKKDKITLSGPTDYSFQLKQSGYYEIRLRKQGTKGYVSQSFYAYGWGSNDNASFEVDKEGRIEVVPGKQTYAPGEQAEILFTTPFDGKMLVTVERDGVYHYEYLQVKNNTAKMTLEVGESWQPNVFINATLFRPHQPNDQVPFLVGHGVAGFAVEKASNHLPVAINAPAKIRPRTTQAITVKTVPEEDVYVTLAVVDEGILQIKGYDSPDPYKYFFAKRQLNVNSYDLYELLLPEVYGSSPVPGGGEGFSERLNPVGAQRFKLLSFWSGIRHTNSQGEVTIQVPIPQYNGEVRIMAVVYKGQRFGSGSQPMKISDDIVLLPSIPRVMSVNDSISMPVSLMNTTDKAGEVQVEVQVKGPLKITSSAKQSVKLSPKGNGQAVFGLMAENLPGAAKIVIKTTGMDHVVDETEIAIRPVSPFVVEDGHGTLKGGQSYTINIPTDYYANTQKTNLMISSFPAVRFAGQLKYLIGYPHGCVEQTVSKVFPQIYFADLAKAVAPEAYHNGNPVYFVREGIRKLESMQLYDGSLAYWPGGSYANWWGSVYAAHFLTEAQKAGYAVNKKVLNDLYKYIQRRAEKKSTYQYTYYTSGNSKTSELKAEKEIIYSLYVLAMAGKGDISLMNYYLARPHLLTPDTKYLLAGAYAHMDKWSAFHNIVNQEISYPEPVRLSGGSFDSEARANAVMLNVLLDVDPHHPKIPVLVKHLSKLVPTLYSTQERSWTFLALGKAAARNTEGNISADVFADGSKVGSWNGKDLKIEGTKLNGKKVTIKTSGSGELYYFWNTQGVKSGANSIPDIDKNLKVRRTFYDRHGQKVANNSFRQGQLYVVQITMEGEEFSADNIAVSDLVPAGMEIENARLRSTPQLSWIKNSFSPDNLDIRDDRILIFTDIGRKQEKQYYYLVRAVTPGRFELPPIGADAMYDPDIRSYHGYGKVRIWPASMQDAL